MHNDSIETLLLRHYGSLAPIPPALEQRMLASVRCEAEELQHQRLMATRIRNHRVSRRRALCFVAMGSAGLGLLSAGLEGLQMLEAGLMGQEVTQMVFP
jgi:hypothetical protein